MQIYEIIVAVVTGVGVPLIIYMLTRQDSDRKAKQEEIHERLGHLDRCIDDVRKTVLGKSVTREDFVAFKAEMTETLNRMRTAISTEASNLDKRIMRLEDPFFARRERD